MRRHVRICQVPRNQTLVEVFKREKEDGNILAHVTEIPFNPKMVFAKSAVCERFEVIVGDNRRLWVDAPMHVRASTDYPGYYELVGELPKGRWDRSYALRFDGLARN